MFKKIATYQIKNIYALNNPSSMDSVIVDQNINVNKEEFELTLQKIASKQAEHNKDGVPDANQHFDLEAEIKNYPDSLFVKCFAIKADEMNDNGDYFSKNELHKATSTFVGVPIFTNHQNTDINQARGKVIHSWWDEDRNGIMVIARVDAIAYPQLARGITQNYVMGTSMGCQVKYSVCSVCHNLAETPAQYCPCIKNQKTREISKKSQKCQYHKYGKDEQCPICGCTKTAEKTFDYDGKVFEYNFGIKFIENSFVVSPACHDCGVTDVIDPKKFLEKVSEIEKTLPKLIKAAASPIVCNEHSCLNMADNSHVQTVLSAIEYLKNGAKYIEKIAGQEQINDLNQALNLLTSVSQDMLKQRAQLDMEFLSDLVKVLADLQEVTDELTEQGYGRLPSQGQTVEVGDQTGQQVGPASVPTPSPISQTTPQTSQMAGPSKVHSGPAGNIGTVTSPLASRKIDLEKWSKNILKTIKKSNVLTHSMKVAQKTKSKSLDIKINIKNKTNKIKDL